MTFYPAILTHPKKCKRKKVSRFSGQLFWTFLRENKYWDIFKSTYPKLLIENQNEKRVLVTGNFGFLGRAVCKRLSELGYDVVNRDTKLDIKNLEALKTQYFDHKVNYIYHLAGKSDVACAEQNPLHRGSDFLRDLSRDELFVPKRHW